MLIVVEGPDGAGKTTLIESLRQRSKRYFSIVRLSGPPDTREGLEEAILLLSKVSRCPIPTVTDRHPIISDEIYGKILRKVRWVDDILSRTERVEIIKRTVDRIIYCCPPLSVIEQCVRSQPQLQGVTSNLREIVDAYHDSMQFWHDNGVKVIGYDWTSPETKFRPDIFFGEI